MTPIEIALEIGALYADLKTALTTESTDYRVLLETLADAHTEAADAIAQIATNTRGMNGPDWVMVTDLIGDTAAELRTLAGDLQAAANHAEAVQDTLAAAAPATPADMPPLGHPGDR